MALTNFIVTVAAVGAVVLLAKGDVRQSAAVFRRNVRHIRNWLEEESSAASKYILSHSFILSLCFFSSSDYGCFYLLIFVE